MADDAAMYRARAEAEFERAREATLDNVRERCERSGKAWSDMADRAERTAVQRHEREAASAARVLAAAP